MRDLHPVMLEARIHELEQNGGGGGTSDYEDLHNKPKIENVELVGNLTFEELGIASAEDLAQTNEDLLDIQQTANQNHADIGAINSKLGAVPDDESVEDQISEIKDNLVNIPRFINTSKAYDTISEYNKSYTLPKDTYVNAALKSSSTDTAAAIALNGVTMLANANANFVRCGFYAKKGDVIATRNSNTGTYDITLYELR